MNPGQTVGGYEIVAAIGAGGMGEVYRARDPRLGRDVAIKVLPPIYAINADRLQRFQQEARAAGMLNHPNLLTVFELGVHDGAPYIVTELLEGETLRERIEGGAGLAPRKVIDYAIQIASGLAAAHEKGVVHRDLKPENLFVTKDGRVKILDFGLAKLATPASGELGDIETMKRETAPGTVMGTAGYMAPEQVRGQAVDHRADVFSLGAVLYELLTGKRAFRGDSSVETLNAILKEDPTELSSVTQHVPPALQRIVEHCLEKNPESRFQSARDLAFHLGAISGSDTGTSRALPGVRARRRFVVPLAIAALVALAAAGAYIVALRTTKPPQPMLRQLSFRRGTVRSARFASDGQTILYGAALDDRPLKIFQTRINAIESAPLPLPDADILAIAPNGELAISVGRKFQAWTNSGTLAVASMLGGTPRPLVENVSFADYAPDGQLAIVRRVNGQDQLEYPIGKPLLRTRGYFSHIRVSPDGNHIAFLDHPVYGDNRGDVRISDRSGTTVSLATDWTGMEGLAWSPDGKEVWFSGDDDGTIGIQQLYGVDLHGKLRTVWSVPTNINLLDVAKDGRVLLAGGGLSGSIYAAGPGDPHERDLSSLAWSSIRAMSPDGKLLLVSSYGPGAGRYYSTYLCPTDGSPPVRLGEGESIDLSPDLQWAASIRFAKETAVMLLPTGAGSPRVVAKGDVTWAGWMPDGKLVVRSGSGKTDRFAIVDPANGASRPLAVTNIPPLSFLAVSPDGKWLLTMSRDGGVSIVPMSGGVAQPVKWFTPQEHCNGWIDNESVYVWKVNGALFHVDRMNVFTGKREPVRDVPVPDSAGAIGEPFLFLSRDGKTYATTITRMVNDLYFVGGMR